MIPELHRLSISNFRSIKGTVHLPLNAPIVLLHGANGTGKTSVLSALELALTGDVAAMRQDDAGFMQHLVHQGTERATLRFSGPSIDTDVGAGVTIIEGGKVVQRRVLRVDQAKFFTERCYLAQSVLGRLLDIYSRADSQKDSPLTRFVKDLLQLDKLDALADGLHDADHLARAKNLVPRLRRADDLRRTFRNTRDKASASFGNLSAELERQRAELRRLVANAAVVPPIAETEYTDLQSLRARLANDGEEAPIIILLQRRRELDSLEAAWLGLPADADAMERGRLEANANSAAFQAQAWKDTTGTRLEAVVEVLREFFPELPSWMATDPQSAFDRARGRVVTDVTRIQNALEQERKAAASATALISDVGRAESRVKIIDEQIAGIGMSIGGLTRALAEIVPHIHSEDCPVCGQNFSKTRQGPLSAHVQQKVATLTQQAGRVSALTTERSQTQARLSELKRQSASVQAARLDSAAVMDLQTRMARLTAPARELVELTQDVAHGAELIRNQARAEGQLAALRDRDRRAGSLRNGIAMLAAELQQPQLAPAEPLAVAVARLRACLQEAEAAAKAAREARSCALAAVDALSALHIQTSQDRQTRDEADAALTILENAYREAERLRAQARRVGSAAREARVAIVRRVFNEGLNNLWRDLFVRLAPTEPFVPAFCLPETAEGVVAQLETRTRSGERGGTPGAMLSAGNLNTAALTLFLALHLSVEPKLPWLVLDDPVQSMDEVHIAQFAALLRTLSKEHRRKVIIAVHDRSLFEYLTLELSPAFANDQLITVDLRRSATEETFADPSFLSYRGEDVVAA